MTEDTDIPSKYGPCWSPSAPFMHVLVERLMLPEAGSAFKSFKLGIAVIPIKRMYLERLRETLTGH